MLRYPSTKQILTVAVLSALLAGCGKDSKKATADSNVLDSAPMAERPAAKDTSVELGSELQLTESSDVARQNQAITLAAIVLSTTLNMDKGSSAVKSAISALASAQPKDVATGAMSPVLGGTTQKCGKGGDQTITLLMGEGVGVIQTGAFNKEEIYVSADFNECNLGAVKIDGGLGLGLKLGLAELLNTSSFRLETSLVAQSLKINQNGREFYAEGEAGYKFYTNNGYVLNTELYADNFEINDGLKMNLIDLSMKQINNTSDASWSMAINAKYQAGKSNLDSTYVSVSTGEGAPLKGNGYGYPTSGEIYIGTKKPNPDIPLSNSVVVKIAPTAVSDSYPEGTRIQVEQYDEKGILGTAVGFPWVALEEAVQKYRKSGVFKLPDGVVQEGNDN